MNTAHELARATALAQRGATAEAELILRAVVVSEPTNGDAIHLLGLLRKQARDPAGALELMRRSVQMSPRRPDFHGNLGNLLRSLGKKLEAEAAYRAALACDPGFRAGRLGLARLLNDLARGEEAESEARVLIERDARDAEAWAVLGEALAGRQLPDQAEAAYRRALDLRPGYAIARHNLGALLAREQRAEEALHELDRAATDGLRGREIQLSRARALFDLGRFDDADAALQSALGAAPLDTESHAFLAKLRYMRGEAAFTRSIEAALTKNPGHAPLTILLADLLRRSGQLERSEAELRGLLERGAGSPQVMAALGMVLQEQGRLAEAEPWVRRAYEIHPEAAGFTENLVVVLLALGRAGETLRLIERQRALQPFDQRWLAYLATAARQLGQPEYELLYDYERFVRAYDLEPPPGWRSIESFHADLLSVLASRHRLEAHPLDQSLRHGTQTPRSLLADPDPVVRGLLASLRQGIAQYRDAIGFDPMHPYLQRNRGEARMVGCWSVRLRRGGYHVNHIHPAGWVSSAYYAQVPAEVADPQLRSGWIKFGEPNVATPGATPGHFVQPQAGRLVLFPSYMWHGTTPILGDEPRITVAFDAAPV